MMTPTVVFKYAEDTTGPGAIVAPYSSIKVEDANFDRDAAYFDALNTWVSFVPTNKGRCFVLFFSEIRLRKKRDFE